jgi:hypothetical protein
MTSSDPLRGQESRPQVDRPHAQKPLRLAGDVELEAVIAGGIHPVYQPIVDLDRGLTVALGQGFAEDPVPGVRGASLAADDPLCQEWDIAVLGPHYAGALVARDLGDDGPDAERRFEFVLTFDRELVVEVATSLISRLSHA